MKPTTIDKAIMVISDAIAQAGYDVCEGECFIDGMQAIDVEIDGTVFSVSISKADA